MKRLNKICEEKQIQTLTCSLEVTAQKTISVKFCEGNIRKQIPPIGLLSLTSARVLCFLIIKSNSPVSFESEKTKILKFGFILTGQIPVWWCTLLAFLAVDTRTRFVIQQAKEAFAEKAVYWMSFQQHGIQWHLFFLRSVPPHLLRCGFQDTGPPEQQKQFSFRASRIRDGVGGGGDVLLEASFQPPAYKPTGLHLY